MRRVKLNKWLAGLVAAEAHVPPPPPRPVHPAHLQPGRPTLQVVARARPALLFPIRRQRSYLPALLGLGARGVNLHDASVGHQLCLQAATGGPALAVAGA